MKLRTTKLFEDLVNCNKDLVVFQGSSGSSKTYSILQYLIYMALTTWKNKRIDVIRRTLPSIKMSVMQDFEDILKSLGVFTKEDVNQTNHYYKIKSNTFRFYSTDDEKKMRGPRRDFVYFNEVLELKKMDVLQVMMRTKEKIYMDYNPSEEFHWLYDDILTREDCYFQISTYKDNPFLPDKTIKEIERLKELDPNLWRIYGLGQRGVAQATIFPNWDYWEKDYSLYEGVEDYGMDFGFNDPTVLVRVKSNDGGILIDELLYLTGLTSEMIIRRLNELVVQQKLKTSDTIYCDGARPEIIEDLRKAGYNVRACIKGPDSIQRGISFMKLRKIFITKSSVNLARELRAYKWRCDKNEKLLDDPVDANDHTIDATRYALSDKSRNKRSIGMG